MQKLLQIFRRSTIYETVILIVFYLFSFLLPLEQPGIGARYFFLILAFSIVLSLAQEIFNIKTIKTFVRYTLHFSVLLASFIVLYFLTGNYAQRGPSSFFVAIVLFTVGYVIVALPIALIRAKIKANKKKKAPSTYKKIYK